MKKDHDYYDQVQGQMGPAGAKWCDFVVYTKAGMNTESQIWRETLAEGAWKTFHSLFYSLFIGCWQVGHFKNSNGS